LGLVGLLVTLLPQQLKEKSTFLAIFFADMKKSTNFAVA
jgi:hypothetical protein